MIQISQHIIHIPVYLYIVRPCLIKLLFTEYRFVNIYFKIDIISIYVLQYGDIDVFIVRHCEKP